MTVKETKQSKVGSLIYQIKVTLEESEPLIWRRIQVASDITLRKLHKILQVAMGWETCHLHEFIVGREHFGEPDPEYDFKMQDDRKTKLCQAAPQNKDRFLYVYDFGDDWRHDLTVEKIDLPKPGAVYPIVLEGERACPPEDCGSIYGYANFLEAIRDSEHPRHEELLRWIGGSFNPEAFHADEINRRLKQVK